MFVIDATPDKILKQQIDSLYRTTMTGGLANIFGAWLVFSMLHISGLELYSLVLTLLITTFSVMRMGLTSYYLKYEKSDHLRDYLSAYVSLTFVIGAAWGAFILLQSMQSNETVSSVIYLIQFGLIAGSLVTLSAWVPAYLAYVIPQSVCVFSVLALQNNEFSNYYAIAFLVFISIMIASGFRYNKAFVHNLRLQSDLLESRSDLERKVQIRTEELENTNDRLRSEITEKNKAKRDLEYLAFHDDLTGLPNKNLLIDRVNNAILSARRNNEKMSLLFLDLDGFKKINDTLGHSIGDQLIREVSVRLQKTLREEDTISRNGGDEFVVLIKQMENTEEIIRIVNKLISSVTRIFDIDSHKIHVGVSVGVSVYPNDGDDGLTLLKNADTAMYSAKKLGGNSYDFYDESMSARLSQRLAIEMGLHSALTRDEFFMMYQPQVDVNTNRIVGYESLMRWESYEHGLVSPGLFVPILEETGLIYEAGKWVISSVIKQIASTKESVPYAINLSPLQCRDESLVDFIEEEIERYEIDSALLEFEITESQLIKDFDKTKIFLKRLHRIGCTVTLDDFGTGYTSMSYLTQLPIDTIKIDQSFIRDIDKSEKLQSIVKAIVTMSKSLGIENIFEGVETREELAVVKKMKGGVVQGFLFGKPMSSVDVKKQQQVDNVFKLPC